MHPKPFIAVIAMCVTASPTFAAGESPSTLAPSRAAEPRFQMPPRTRWYGVQPVVTDVLAVGLSLESMATSRLCIHVDLYSGSSSEEDSCDNTTSEVFGIASLGLYGLGGPVAHATRDHWDKAALSLGIRAAPIVIAVPLASSRSDTAPFVLIFGTLAAMIVDDAILANDEVPEEPKWSFAPAFDPLSRSGTIALGHAF
jgi:hypothetical protein